MTTICNKGWSGRRKQRRFSLNGNTAKVQAGTLSTCEQTGSLIICPLHIRFNHSTNMLHNYILHESQRWDWNTLCSTLYFEVFIIKSIQLWHLMRYLWFALCCIHICYVFLALSISFFHDPLPWSTVVGSHLSQDHAAIQVCVMEPLVFISSDSRK